MGYARDRDFIRLHPKPGSSARDRLAHTLAVFADQPDSMAVLTATYGIYGPHESTGITLGDLRALAALVAPPVDPAA